MPQKPGLTLRVRHPPGRFCGAAGQSKGVAEFLILLWGSVSLCVCLFFVSFVALLGDSVRVPMYIMHACASCMHACMQRMHAWQRMPVLWWQSGVVFESSNFGEPGGHHAPLIAVRIVGAHPRLVGLTYACLHVHAYYACMHIMQAYYACMHAY